MREEGKAETLTYASHDDAVNGIEFVEFLKQHAVIILHCEMSYRARLKIMKKKIKSDRTHDAGLRRQPKPPIYGPL